MTENTAAAVPRQTLPNDNIPRWRPGDPLPKWADKHDLARILTFHAEPISPDNLKFHPLVKTKPSRANLFDVADAVRYFTKRIEMAGKQRAFVQRSFGNSEQGAA